MKKYYKRGITWFDLFLAQRSSYYIYVQAEVDADNRIFLHDLDSALNDLQKWREMREQAAQDAEEASSFEGEGPETDNDERVEREVFSLPFQSARMADEKAVRLKSNLFVCKYQFMSDEIFERIIDLSPS